MACPYTHELTEDVTERTWLVQDRACQKFSVVREGIARAKSFPLWKATNHWWPLEESLFSLGVIPEWLPTFQWMGLHNIYTDSTELI